MPKALELISPSRIFSLVVIFLFFFFAAPQSFAFAPTPTPIAGAIQATVTADNLRVRAAPSTDGAILGSFNKGDLVQILARNAETSWWQIAFPDPGRRGWVSAQFISPLGPTDSVPVAGAAPAPPTRTATLPASQPLNTVALSTATLQNTPTNAPSPTPSNTPIDTPLPSITLPPSPTVSPTPTLAPTNTPTATPTPPGRDPKRALFVSGTDQVIGSRYKIWYRFEYLGDRSPISIAVDGFGVKDLEVLIYTPDQMGPNFTEPTTNPTGRGGGNRTQTGHDVFWTGAFPSGGTAYIAIVNSTTRAIVFRVGVAGTGIVTTPFQLPDNPQPSAANDSPISGIRVEAGSAVKPTASAPLAFLDLDLTEVRGNRAKWLRDLYSGNPTTLFSGPTQVSNEPLTTIYVIYPAELGIPPLPRTVPIAPNVCTPPEAIGVVVTLTIKLCPNATYRPINISGNFVGIFQDDANTALIKSEGRSFAVTAAGDGIYLQGIKVQGTTDPQDRGKWVCAYDKCKFGNVFVEGGPVYGGGISISGSNTIVKDVTVTGGTIGVALLEGTDNFLINNHLLYQTGWASYNRFPQRTQFLGNQFNYANRDCRGPDGVYYSQGCETAGWICISCVEVLLLNNECKRGGNCYYVSGDGGTPSFNVKFVNNTCFAAPNNCFEATFSKGIYFERNQAKKDPFTGEQCNYPFWIGGSEVTFAKGNDWACLVNANTARTRSETSGAATTVKGSP